VQLVEGDLVRLVLKRPFSDVTVTGIRRYLRWLGEASEPPALAPARGPPFFQSVALRRKLGEPVQAELFDAH
jgi:hypothetical protein